VCQSDLYNLTEDIYAANIEFYFDELIGKSLHICFILTLLNRLSFIEILTFGGFAMVRLNMTNLSIIN